MRDIDTIIVHCSATPPHRDIRSADIKRWHVEDNGWSDIGYHWVICRDGVVEEGRPVHRIGAHARGHNKNSIGICMVGGTDADDRSKADFNFTYRQMHSLLNLCMDLRAQYPIKVVRGHRDFDLGKACPCFNVGAWFNG